MADRQLNSFRMNYCRIFSYFFDFLSCLVEMWFGEIWLAEIRVIRLKIATVTTTVFCCFAQFVFGIFTREAKNCLRKIQKFCKKNTQTRKCYLDVSQWTISSFKVNAEVESFSSKNKCNKMRKSKNRKPQNSKIGNPVQKKM